MNTGYRTRRGANLVLLGLGLSLAATVVLFGGCKKVTGTRVDNEAPVVWFANVPPQDQQFSANPLVHWVGQDRDGQVVQYRYRVIRQTTMLKAINQDTTLGIPPADIDPTIITQYINYLTGTAPDSVWTYLTVDPQSGQPQTGVIVPLVAELSDPVRVYVPQWVYVQAIDDRGLFSNVAYRRFVRNNNPPNTRILGFDSTLTPFIDAVEPGGIATGIRFMWTATDILDYPTEPPPFEFQWRLYGPFDSATFKTMENKFRRVAFVTNDARAFVQDAKWDTLEFCDTAYYPEGVYVECDTLIVDTCTVANLYGHLDTIFNVNDPEFDTNSAYNIIADSSKNGITGWVTNLRDSIYDVFRSRPSPNTQQGRFLFWIRGRDDAKGPDVAPAFVSFLVVSPKYEHTLLVADAQISYEINPRVLSRAKLYWDSVYTSWNGSSAGWDISRDYHMISQSAGNILPLSLLLSHKMVVIVCDDVIKGVFNTPDIRKRVFTALDAGVSVWMCGRSMIAGDEAKPPEWMDPVSAGWPRDDRNAARNYTYYFGPEGYQHSGWSWFYILKDPPQRIEDFIGTSSLNTDQWPDLAVDTARLRRYYGWGGDAFPPFRADIGALPEVGYMISGFGTEVMHLYRSKFGNQLLPDPIGKSFDGRPVMHRLNRGVFRSVMSLFTPYSFYDGDANGVGKTVRNTLDFMYFPFQQGAAPGTAEFYFPSGSGTVSREEARAIHWQPVEEGFSTNR
jgi:hypothetical protein